VSITPILPWCMDVIAYYDNMLMHSSYHPSPSPPSAPRLLSSGFLNSFIKVHPIDNVRLAIDLHRRTLVNWCRLCWWVLTVCQSRTLYEIVYVFRVKSSDSYSLSFVVPCSSSISMLMSFLTSKAICLRSGLFGHVVMWSVLLVSRVSGYIYYIQCISFSNCHYS
jgi:hypothetical protein